MAQLTISLTHDCNYLKLGVYKNVDNLYSLFEKRWKDILDLFEGKFLNNGYVIANPSGIFVDTSSFPNLDDGKPNYDRAVCRFLAGDDGKNYECDDYQGNDTVGWGTGQEGFPKEFYNDLYVITSIYDAMDYSRSDADASAKEAKAKIEIEAIKNPTPEDKKIQESEHGFGFFCGDITVDGDDGYYAINVNLTRKGVTLFSRYYEEGEDDW